MAYSKAYQTVVAGSVRETESIGYFKNNTITTPAGNVSVCRTGGSTVLPTITVDYLGSENVGKLPTTRTDALNSYDAGSNNVSMS